MSKPYTPVVLTVPEWNTASLRYMQPKVNDRGAKSINIISGQTGRSLHISTPLMMTWGISDYVDEKTGESDGKFSMSLNFPNEDYSTPATTEFLTKLKQFENQILDDAVRNSEAWFGEEMSREVAKHTFFPFLKYSKDKMTKRYDYSKPPSIRAKVPNYNNRWVVEIYDTKGKLIFPCDNENLTPMDFVPKKSNVACVLQCGGLWFGGKGWGITWKLNQCVVKPQETVSVFGKCHIQLSTDEIQTIETQEVSPVVDDEVEEQLTPVVAATSTLVEDSDDDEAPKIVPSEEQPEMEESVAPIVAKKVLKKASQPLPESSVAVEEAPEEVMVAATTEPVVVKKKIVKKK
jgi:hypothetical protein